MSKVFTINLSSVNLDLLQQSIQILQESGFVLFGEVTSQGSVHYAVIIPAKENADKTHLNVELIGIDGNIRPDDIKFPILGKSEIITGHWQSDSPCTPPKHREITGDCDLEKLIPGLNLEEDLGDL